jgi:tripartite-type tricarboxylate transporter receptor subunit TctC
LIQFNSAFFILWQKMISFKFSSVRTLFSLCATNSFAQSVTSLGPNGYPNAGRVSIVVPFAPGGATDIIARLLADELSKKWGAAVIVEKKRAQVAA